MALFFEQFTKTRVIISEIRYVVLQRWSALIGLEKEMRKIAVLAGLLVMPFAVQANMITNGNFEAGNIGFSSSYGFVDYDNSDPLFGTPPLTPANGGGQGMYDQGKYTITNVQPGAWHDLWRNDVNLTGHGWYMLFNGSTAGNTNAWSQNVAGLEAGKQYQLSFDIFTAYALDTEPANISISVGGSNVGSVVAPSGAGQWQNVFLNFTYTGGTDLVSLLNIETAFSGNDFGIDNISLNPVPEPFTMTLGVLGVGAFLRRRMAKKA